MRRRLAEGADLERRLADLVNEAYGLTPEEVDLMWRTAPPRMPIDRPAPSPPAQARALIITARDMDAKERRQHGK